MLFEIQKSGNYKVKFEGGMAHSVKTMWTYELGCSVFFRTLEKEPKEKHVKVNRKVLEKIKI